MAAESETATVEPTGEPEAAASSQAGDASVPAVSSEAGSSQDAAGVSATGGKPKDPGKGKDAGKGKGKGKEKSKGKKDKPADGEADGSDGLTLAAHPRAARRVAEAKAWGALCGFILGGYLSLPTHTFVDAGIRALAAGAFCYVAVWGAAVFVWRRLVVAELREAQQQAIAARIARAQAEPPALPPGAPGLSAER